MRNTTGYCHNCEELPNADMETDLREEAKPLIDSTPKLTWDQLMYELYVRQ